MLWEVLHYKCDLLYDISVGPIITTACQNCLHTAIAYIKSKKTTHFPTCDGRYNKRFWSTLSVHNLVSLPVRTDTTWSAYLSEQTHCVHNLVSLPVRTDTTWSAYLSEQTHCVHNLVSLPVRTDTLCTQLGQLTCHNMYSFTSVVYQWFAAQRHYVHKTCFRGNHKDTKVVCPVM